MCKSSAITSKQLIAATLVICACLACFVWGFQRGHKQGAEGTITTRVDTLYLRDTIVQYRPKEVAKIEVCKVYLPGDTIRLHDTLYIQATREQKTYEGEQYTAWVSGVLPELDSIHIYNTTKIVTRHEVKQAPRWGFSVQLGIGGQYGIVHRKFDCGPYLGVGVHYRFGAKTAK